MKKTFFLTVLILVHFLTQTTGLNQPTHYLAPFSKLSTNEQPHIHISHHYVTNGVHGPIPVTLDLGEHVKQLSLSETVIQKILMITSWRYNSKELKQLFNVQISGRSIILPLAPSEYIRFKGRIYTAIKLKGVTDHGAIPQMVPYKQQNDQTHIKPSNTILMIKNGRVQTKKAYNKPTGTSFLSKSIHEYNAMLEANVAGIKTGLPLGVGTYPGWRFEEQQVGFTLIAIEEFPDKRLGEHLETNIKTLKLKKGIDYVFAYSKFRVRSTLLLNSAAITLGHLNSHGLTIKNPHLDNFGKLVFGDTPIYDFESSLNAKELSLDEFIFWTFHDIKLLYRHGWFHIADPGMLNKLLFNYLGLYEGNPIDTTIMHFLASDQQSIEDLIFKESTLKMMKGRSLETLFNKWRKHFLFRLIESRAKVAYELAHPVQETFEPHLTYSDLYEISL